MRYYTIDADKFAADYNAAIGQRLTEDDIVRIEEALQDDPFNTAPLPACMACAAVNLRPDDGKETVEFYLTFVSRNRIHAYYMFALPAEQVDECDEKLVDVWREEETSEETFVVSPTITVTASPTTMMAVMKTEDWVIGQKDE